MSSVRQKNLDLSNLPPVSLDRMVRAVEKVRERLLRASAALQAAGIHFAVAGGNAVAAWVSRVDESAVRNTQDVDILVRREDFDRVKAALESAGFVHGSAMNDEFFLDGPDAKIRDAVHLLFAGEKVRESYHAPTPDVSESDNSGKFPVVDLEALVRMKLTSFRDKDRIHLRDMLEINMIDSAWPRRFPTELGDRLQQLLDDPDG